MTVPATDTRWYQAAACRGADPAFDLDNLPGNSDLGTEVAYLRQRYCDHCPVAQACLTDALAGQTDRQRVAISTVRGGMFFNDRGWVVDDRPRRCLVCGAPPVSDVARYCAACRGPAQAETARQTRPPCGTDAGMRSHNRYGEPACEPCKQAHRVASAERRARRAQQRREVAA